MGLRLQVLAIVGSLGLLVLLFHFMRTRRLNERYALLWLLTGVVLLLFASWRPLIDRFGTIIGVGYSPTALFLVGMGFFTLILLHFSTVVSELAERSRRLAQTVAMLQWKIEQLEREQKR